MGIPQDMTYPKGATKAAWDKGKSLADKMSSKTKHTGLGPALAAAEEAWKAIPFGDLVPAPLKIKSVAEAQAALAHADAILKKEVVNAYIAIRKAKQVALTQSLNVKLSTASQGAAKTASKALDGLVNRHGSFDTDEFEALVEIQREKENKTYAKSSGQLTELVFKNKAGQVATATKGVWNRRELKAEGLTWTKGRGNDYMGQTLTVEARQSGDDHKEDKLSGRISDPKAKFINDLKVDSVSGNKAVLKP